mgnify:FL=1
MSNVFFILLLAVGFAGWKVLDHFQLPNTFSILLLILTALSLSTINALSQILQNLLGELPPYYQSLL